MRSQIFYKVFKSFFRTLKRRRSRLDGYVFDARTGLLRVGEREATLRPKTAALFSAIAAEPDRIFSKSELLDRFWPGLHVQDQAIFQCVNEIRQAFGSKSCIRTHSRLGYQWAGPSTPRMDEQTDEQPRLPLRRSTAILASASVLFVAGALNSDSAPATAEKPVRVAVLPAQVDSPAPKDHGLSLALMEMIDRRAGALEDVETVPASDVLRAMDRDPSSGASAMRDALDADIIVRVEVERDSELLTAQFTIEGEAGRVEGVYESASPAWLTQQIAYDVNDAVRYSLVPDANAAARIGRHRALIAAKRRLYDFRPDLAAPALANIAAEDPSYLTAQYYSISTRRELDAKKLSEEIARVLDASRATGDRLNETRALLLSAREAWRGGDRVAASAFAKAGRRLASRHEFDSLDAAFDFGDGAAFAALGEFDRAAAAFRRAETRYQEADCIVGLVTTYSQLSRTLIAAGALPEARAVSARIGALYLMSPQIVSHALAAAQSS